MAARPIIFTLLVAGLGLVFVVAASAQTNRPSDMALPTRATVAWQGSRIVGTPDQPLPLRIEPAFAGLKFNDPMQIRWQADCQRYFVCELGGKLWSFPHAEQAQQADLVIDLKSAIKSFDPEKSRGVDSAYSIVFDPNFKENRYIYVCMIFNSKSDPPLADGTRVSRFEVSRTDPPTIDAGTELPIITWLVGGHNGCDMAFDNTGCLLISTGDATAPVPPDGLNTGQDCSDLLASVLRIDVRGAAREQPYRVPDDNPFVDRPGVRPEIWAFGFRNPWRISVDRDSGQLWLGDVGWEKWEMVHRVERGGNYGWSIREGFELLRPEVELGPSPILPPRLALSHADSASITGGFVYRGRQLPSLYGQYLFGDWVNGRIWAVPLDDHSPHAEVASGQLRIIAFEPDRDGEPLVVNHLGQTSMFRLVPNDNYESELSAAQQFPRRLSETGLFEDVAQQQPAIGVIPFSINQAQWQDGAIGSHFIALPGQEYVTVYKDPQPVDVLAMFNSRLHYPTGSVLIKTLTMPPDARQGRESAIKLETQLLHFDGRLWRGYSYRWNQQQDDAELVDASGTEFLVPGSDQQRWRIHSRTECMQCHNPWPETTLAFTPEQLHQPERGADSTWLKLVKSGFVVTKASNQQAIEPEQCVRQSLSSSAPDVAQRARAYLHVNCAHCHQNGAGSGVTLSLRMQDQGPQMLAIDQRPSKGDFGILDGRIIAPGQPHRSTLLYRLASSSAGRMPHIGSREVDFAAVSLVSAWISGMNDQPGTNEPANTELANTEPANTEQGSLQQRASALQQSLAATSSDTTTAQSAQARSQRLQAALRLAIELSRQRSATSDGNLSAQSAAQTSAQTSAPWITELAQAADPLIASLFEAHLPARQRAGRLGPGAVYAEVADLVGDAGRGQTYFSDVTRSQCSKCHRVGEQGGQVGPALDDIGLRQTAGQIFESIMQPDRIIEPRYQSHVVLRSDGQVITGLLDEETADHLQLINAQGERIKIAQAEIETRKIDSKSLMPSGLAAEMTAQQMADLIAYLSSLKMAQAPVDAQVNAQSPTRPVAPSASQPPPRLRIQQTEQQLSVLWGDRPVLVYNIQSPPAPEGIDKVYERSGFMHPIYAPSGQVLTAAFPIDHKHQHGIFTAWVNTRFRDQAIDFWNLAGNSGRVLHEKLISATEAADGSVSFEVDLLHRALVKEPVDVLRERWKVTVAPTDGTYYQFDLESHQHALTDDPLIVQQYHYGGMAVRGNVAWVLPKDGGRRQITEPFEPNELTNGLGQNRLEGNHAHARWNAISGTLSGQSVSLAVLDHPRNFRAPQAARLHPTKPYFVYSPCVDGQFTIDRQHPYRARYRFLITSSPLAKGWLDQQWHQWAQLP